jgi:perosamine synthetase
MIPVFKPSFGDEELEALKEPFKTGWIGLGPKTKEFEEKFAKYIGTNYAVGTNSCTAALHLALKVMDIEGKEVITTPMTFISTNHAILYNGGIPVFCDIEDDTLNIDASKIEELVTERTAAIMVVHYGGHACDMDKVLEIAKKHDLKITEDCAHACGGEYRGRKLGSIGDISCFSFHAVKNLATGEGGMVNTDDSEVAGHLKKLRWLGISADTFSREEKDTKKYSWHYEVEDLGFKYHMHDITAAIGLVQLKKLDKMNQRREEIVKRYNAGLKGLSWIKVPVVKNYAKPSYHNYVIKTQYRDQLNDYLKSKGISTGVHYVPNHHYKMYRKFKADVPVCESIWKQILTLPLFPDLTNEQVDMIINAIKDFKDRR